MNEFNKIGRVFDDIIDLHLKRLERLDPELENRIGSSRFAKEYKTVRIDIGRQVGKTKYIARSASTGDIIICYNEHMANEMKKLIINYNITGTIHTVSASSLRSPYFYQMEAAPGRVRDARTPPTIWIDEASLLSKKDLNLIYYMYNGANQFILIG